MHKALSSILKSLMLAILLLGAFSVPASVKRISLKASAPPPDLTGVWMGDDGATYYIRQADKEIWWFGQGKGFANVFHGSLGTNGGFTGRWADVPMQSGNSYGNLALSIVNNDQFVQAGTSNFSAKMWNRKVSSGGVGGESMGGSSSGMMDVGEIDWETQATSPDLGKQYGGGLYGLRNVLEKLGVKSAQFQTTCKPAPSGYNDYSKHNFRVSGQGPLHYYTSSICMTAVYEGVIKDVTAKNIVRFELRHSDESLDFSQGCGEEHTPQKIKNGVRCFPAGQGSYAIKLIP